MTTNYHPSSLHYTSLALILMLALSSCTPDPYFKLQAVHESYSNSQASILNRARISPASKRILKKMRKDEIQNPSNIDERIAIAESAIRLTKSRIHKGQTSAIPYYLKASEVLWPIVRDTPYPENPTSDGELRSLLAHQLYGHAVSHATSLLIAHSNIKHNQHTITIKGHRISFNTTSPHSRHPSFFDAIQPLDSYTYGNVGKYHYKTKGLGVAVVGHQAPPSDSELQTTSYIPIKGIDIPVNIIIDFPKPNYPRITLTDLLKTNTSTLTGNRRKLSADYSAAVAAISATQSSSLGLSIATSRQNHEHETALFSIGPYDPEKIPVIFVHGLISQPATWTTTTNRLIADDTIRKNYQFHYYLYPTGYSPIVSGARLRQHLLDLYEKHSPNPKLHRTVLIGHSMGGLLSSIQSRTFDGQLWSQLFDQKPTQYDHKSAYAQMRVLYENPTLPQIERTVFIATPHQGSHLANGWIGRVGSSLIRLPQSINSLQMHVISDNMTELGRSIVNDDHGPPNSITQLKANNPSLKLLSKQAFSSRVIYHSIIGDQGKGTGDRSSDGVVPYWSSHIKGADSEKIVPSDHDVHLHSDTHEELVRILHQHLKSQR